MNFKFVRAIVVLTGLLALSVSMSAASAAVKVHVPFAFIAGSRTLPAGDYVIEESGESGVLLVRGTAPGASVAVLTVTAPSTSRIGVTFRREASGLYLSRVELAGASARLLIQSERRGPSGPASPLLAPR